MTDMMATESTEEHGLKMITITKMLNNISCVIPAHAGQQPRARCTPGGRPAGWAKRV